MGVFRVAALFIMCGVALSALGKSMPQNSANTPAAQTDDIPKSIAESVSGTLQFVEGDFLGLPCLKTSIRSSPPSASSTACAASANK